MNNTQNELTKFNENLIKELLESKKEQNKDLLFCEPHEDNPFNLETILDIEEEMLNSKNTCTNANTVCSTLDFLKHRVKNQNTIGLLEKQIMFVHLIYDDGSALILTTTLNSDILAKNYTSLKEGYLFDLKRYRYIRLYDECVEIIIAEHDLYKDNEVIQFANRFI